MSTAATRSAAEAPEGVRRLLDGVRADGRAVSVAEHLQRYGPLPRSGRELIAELQSSGLRGRGGGAFPTGDKLAAVAAEKRRPVVVVNATEGEPASTKDRVLVGLVPHLVLDGAASAASALGARTIIIAVARRGGAVERGILAAALRERREKLDWQIASIPDGFVSGEETALVNTLNSKAGKPSVKPPYPFDRGVGGAPTLVQNAETLAHVALIARFGTVWFRSLGTEAEPGTALVSVSGAVARPGVYEVELGTRISEVIVEAGGLTEPISASLVGGYFGGWTRDPKQQLTAAGGLGAGVIVALPKSACGVRESARVTRFLAGESAGQCGPCVHGLEALATGLEDIAHGQGRDGRDRLVRWAGQVTGRGACRHPDGVARFVMSTLAVFEDEFTLHSRKGRCSGRDRAILPTAEPRH
jgi:NADH:ubiquinone oxidoreductase subunit F (NADH-binding)